MKANNNKSYIIPLIGVDNDHCAHIVGKALEKMPNISSFTVEPNNERAIIESNNEDSVLIEVVKTIREIGYDVRSVKKTIPVLLMSCASCAGSVESILKNQKGVISANVNFASSTVLIEYFPEQITLEELQKVVQSIGYDLVIEKENEETTSMEEFQELKLKQLRTRTIGAAILSFPVAMIGMFFMEIPFANFIMWVLSTPIIIWFGKDFFINAWKQAKHRSANMDTLVALSTGVAYIFSVYNTLFPEFWHKQGLHAHVYFEAAAVVITFILLGKLFEEKAKGNTSSAIKKLIGLQAKKVTIIHEGGHQMEIDIDKVSIGDIILVKPGEKIAVDGVVINGNSYVNESMLSGEPIPLEKKEGEKVFAGTINQKGSFQFRAEKVGSETLLSHIIKMVQEAQGSKAPVQKLVDKIAGIFVPVVIGIALVSFVLWLVFGGENGFTHGLMAMVTVLIIACPCALGLATPTAIMVGVGKGAEKGILIKDAESLELAKKVNTIVLDKTGTITEGKPKVTNVSWLNENDQHKNILVSLEKQSEHPLAEAIVDAFKDETVLKVNNFESITGKGAKAEVNGKTWLVGNDLLMEENKIERNEDLIQQALSWGKVAKTVIWFADIEQAYGIVAIADEIKKTSKAAILELKDMGIEVFMLTGDNEFTAKAISEETGITNYKAEVLPQQKLDFIKKLQSEGRVVAMVGDGINDSSALAQADVSIAMGKGSDIAIDVAKMTIISSDLMKIPTAIHISKQTVSTIKQNLFWAFIYNIIGIPIAAGILYPFTGFLLNPMIAGAAMALSSISVVGNSLRMKWRG